jgi:hypothetical protein
LQVTTNLAALPTGWSSAAPSLSCTSVSSGNGCALSLTYNPPGAGAGTLTLNYAYKNNAGQMRTGSLNIPYRATTDDTVAGAPNPSPISVITGSSGGVTVTFTTDDGNPASALSITSGLNPLLAGWSSTATTFSCATVSAGTPCQLPLTYTPSGYGSGTLSLGYSYTNDAGIAKTGTVNIGYQGTTDDTVGGAVSPSPVAVVHGTVNPVTVTFTTSDGNPASMLAITSGLGALPADWSGPATFTCGSVSTGTGCQLSLSYQPTAPETPGPITLNFSYTNDAGIVKTGSVTINYSAT